MFGGQHMGLNVGTTPTSRVFHIHWFEQPAASVEFELTPQDAGTRGVGARGEHMNMER